MASNLRSQGQKKTGKKKAEAIVTVNLEGQASAQCRRHCVKVLRQDVVSVLIETECHHVFFTILPLQTCCHFQAFFAQV